MTKKEIKLLDKVWSDLVKAIAKFTCEHCGIRGIRMEAAHVVGRRHRGTRWGAFLQLGDSLIYDLCGHCLCHGCHQQYDEHGPLEGLIVIRTIGIERKEAINQVARKIVAKDQNYDNVLEILEEIDDQRLL